MVDDKRRTKFSVVTNKMSDQVYDHLNSKLNSRELTSYLIDLVEKDLNGEFGNADYDSIMKEIKALNNTVNSIERIKVKGEVEVSEESLVELPSDNDDVKGEIDEDLEFDM